MSEEKLNQLKNHIDSLKEEKSKAEGKLDSLTESLKKDFSISTIEEAEKLLLDLEDKVSKTEEKYTSIMEQINSKWEFE